MRSYILGQLRTDLRHKTHIGSFQIPVPAFYSSDSVLLWSERHPQHPHLSPGVQSAGAVTGTRETELTEDFGTYVCHDSNTETL